MEPAEYLKSRLDNQIDWYDTKSQHHQKWFKILKYTEVLMGFLIPLLAICKPIKFELWSAVFAGSMLLCESFISISQHHDNWSEVRGFIKTKKMASPCLLNVVKLLSLAKI